MKAFTLNLNESAYRSGVVGSLSAADRELCSEEGEAPLKLLSVGRLLSRSVASLTVYLSSGLVVFALSGAVKSDRFPGRSEKPGSQLGNFIVAVLDSKDPSKVF